MTVTSRPDQYSMSFGENGPESPDFLSRQLVTYIGNKRSLLDPIRSAVNQVYSELGKRKLRTYDAFSGSGVVSRLLKQYSYEIVANDIEPYAEAISNCYLTNRSTVDWNDLELAAKQLNGAASNDPITDGFIRQMYAPADEENISKEDRVFYTVENAVRLDTIRSMLEQYPERIRELLLGPLLSAASIHANTAGVFKGFYKDRVTGIGQFGGSGSDALSRIKAQINVCPPILSEFECDTTVIRGYANETIPTVGDFDVVYVDPPYNQHPYGSNYFMLNLITSYLEPSTVSKVSGIPTDWNRSGYNVRKQAIDLLDDFVTRIPAKFVILSFNDEGFISPDEMRSTLLKNGSFTEVQTKYNTFRGSRNLAGRSTHVTEHLYILKKRD